jgi:superfamily II DNA or RNA helicase
MQALMNAVRQACSPAIWSQGVSLSRAGAVREERRAGDEVEVRVSSKRGAVAPLVTLWPRDIDWSCDCVSAADACVHVAAAVIALNQARRDGRSLADGAEAQATLMYRFRRNPGGLRLDRVLQHPKGEQRVELTLATLAQGNGPPFSASATDQAIDTMLVRVAPGVLHAPLLRRVLTQLVDCTNIELDGKAISVGEGRPVVQAKVTQRHSGAYMLSVVQDPSISEIFANGAVRCGNVLRPIEDPKLGDREMEELRRGRVFGDEDLITLVADVLPSLRQRVPVAVVGTRLPEAVAMPPRIVIEANRKDDSLEVLPTLVYGTPPIARLDRGKLKRLGDTIPRRDEAAETRLIRHLREQLGLEVGLRHSVENEAALALAARLHAWGGEVTGDALNGFYLAPPLRPKVQIDGAHNDHFTMDFQSVEDGMLPLRHRSRPTPRADTAAVLRAWQAGQRLVPLLGGGWAELPQDWLHKHGDRLLLLLDAQQDRSALPAHAMPELGRLCDSLDAPKPPELQHLQQALETFEGIPVAPLPADLTATLRDYQRQGVSWLTFLRQHRMGAMLADDMGLGKTLQALCAVHGRTLVVAPTSVLVNWNEEASKFRPALRSCVYHGPQRQLDADADLVLTTYAILRLDAERLAAVHWDTVVLDEAQLIKNPESQVAQAAYGLQATFRITLTGTPVENRLDELWSQFHFINPGLLGSRRDFVARLGKPIADGEPGAAAKLRERIRPFMLRRLKRDVAPELPSRTDVVLHCTLSSKERAVYDAVRAATLHDVVERLQAGGGVLQALEALLRLRQACCHSALVPGQKAQSSSKLDLLLEQLVQAAAEGHRALVFSQWTNLLDLAEPHLRAAKLDFVRLDGTTEDRGAVVKQFQAEDGPPVMLVSLKAGGTGLTLTAADHVFLLDPWWNPAVEDQAADRAHRIGQQRPVFVHRLVAEKTVEEKILGMQAEKRAVATAALEGADKATSLTRDDLLALLID